VGLSVVARISTLEEAQVACGALRAAGFRAEVFDHVVGTVYWLYQNAVGGFRIVVPAAELEDAVAYLSRIQSDRRRLRRPRRKGDELWSVAALGAFLWLHPALAWAIVAARKARRGRRLILNLGALILFVMVGFATIAIGTVARSAGP
jgi:hypothetical protein